MPVPLKVTPLWIFIVRGVMNWRLAPMLKIFLLRHLLTDDLRLFKVIFLQSPCCLIMLNLRPMFLLLLLFLFLLLILRHLLNCVLAMSLDRFAAMFGLLHIAIIHIRHRHCPTSVLMKMPVSTAYLMEWPKEPVIQGG